MEMMDTRRKCNVNIENAIRLAEELMQLSDNGDEHREDDGCGVLYGVIRDSAYKIMSQAESEKENHKRNGRWD